VGCLEGGCERETFMRERHLWRRWWMVGEKGEGRGVDVGLEGRGI
jgi:hypothetical protein